MRSRAAITGCGWRLGQPFRERPDVVVREAVLAALAASCLSIEDIDTFVTVASDTLDGMSVPGRAEIAGAYGRRYLNVPSAAGHGLAAAATQIEAGEARNLILVGWGAATKLRERDGRDNQADPFYARPIGASPRVVAALQAQELLGLDGMNEAFLNTYVQDMASRAWGAAAAIPSGAAPAWARSAFCDGAVAIVVRRAEEVAGGVTIGDIANVSRAYSPEDDCLDTAGWVREAMAGFSSSAAREGQGFATIEAAAPTPIAESRALHAVGAATATARARANRSGGGACAYFGAATGLRQIAEASNFLAAQKRDGSTGSALVLDLCGPLGQHTTAAVLQTGGPS